MKNSSTGLSVKTWVLLVGFLGSPGIVAAAEQEFSGEVVRVGSDAKRVILNVSDGQSVEGKQVTVLVNRGTRFQGVQQLSELEEGVPVKVKAKKSWFSQQWVAKRLIYVPSERPLGASPTEKAQLHDIESKFAQGQMGDIEYETKRQEFSK